MTIGDLLGVLTRTDDGVTVTFERCYATTPEDLWEILTAPERVARWLGPVYGELRVDGEFEIRMGDDLPGSDQTASGQVLACDAPHHLAVSWRFPGEVVTRIEVDVRAGDAGAVLELRHLDLAEGPARGYGSGWHASLGRLEDVVGGRPVRSWDDLFEAARPSYRDAVCADATGGRGRRGS